MKALFVSLVLIALSCALMNDMEPQCYSRFDYEYKVVQKLFELENARKQQEEFNKALEVDVENTKTVSEKNRVTLEDKNREVQSAVEEMKSTMDTLIKEVQTLTAQLEEMKGKNEQIIFAVAQKLYCVFYKLAL